MRLRRPSAALRRAVAWSSNRRRLRRIAHGRRAESGIRVFYGYDVLPGIADPVSGGLVKFQRLTVAFPNSPLDFNVLYAGSSSPPPDLGKLVRLTRRRGAAFVWNQNGVAYPAWAGRRTARINRPMSASLHEADHVFYQSEFCRLSADRWLGRRAGPGEVLYNCVDTRTFVPAPSRPAELTLLLAGNQYAAYRLLSVLEAVRLVAREHPAVRLVVAGKVSWPPALDRAQELARRRAVELGVGGLVDFVGPYTQRDAPALLQRASLLVHPQYNDASPGLVLEALACGLPVVHSASGGVPELVGADCGMGIPAPLDWERLHPPAPAALAAAILAAAERLPELADAARARAVERFDVRPWVARHAEVFETLVR